VGQAAGAGSRAIGPFGGMFLRAAIVSELPPRSQERRTLKNWLVGGGPGERGFPALPSNPFLPQSQVRSYCKTGCFCHPERREGSHLIEITRFFASLRMIF